MKAHARMYGFTLIEISVVLVIIGLIIGGILAGRDLITASAMRAQSAQIKKYNAAVNTFNGKFNSIPGDMINTVATRFGFTVGATCDGSAGRRDGNGLIDGGNVGFLNETVNETGLFWQDLTSAAAGNLTDGVYPNNGVVIACNAGTGNGGIAVSGTTIATVIPPAKIGNGNYVYVYETSGANWFAVSAVTAFDVHAVTYSNTNIPVIQAYKMDTKLDDGNP